MISIHKIYGLLYNFIVTVMQMIIFISIYCIRKQKHVISVGFDHNTENLHFTQVPKLSKPSQRTVAARRRIYPSYIWVVLVSDTYVSHVSVRGLEKPHKTIHPLSLQALGAQC